MNIISLTDARESREPHTRGDAICCACRHEWHAVVKSAPVGDRITWFECPACGAIRGQFKHHFTPATGSAVFECGACGSTLWTPYRPPESSDPWMMCAGCGKDVIAMDLFLEEQR